MNRRARQLAVVGLLAFPAAALSAQDASESAAYLGHADQAIREGRMVQAAEMIGWLKTHPDGIRADDIALLDAELSMARNDIPAVTQALAAIADPASNFCRQEGARGWLASQQGQPNKAIGHLGRTVRECSDDVGAWNLLALNLLRKSEFAAAKSAFDQALVYAPQQADLLNNRALAYLCLGNIELASRDLDAAIATARSDAAIRANRDFVNGLLGKLPKRTPNETDSEWGRRLAHAARGAQAAGRADAATALFTQALLALDQHDTEIWTGATGELGAVVE